MSVRGLSLRARVLIALTAAAAAGVFVWALRFPHLTRTEIGLTVGLAMLASLAQTFEVHTPNNKAYVSTVAFLLASAFLVGPLGACIVAAAPFVTEQLRKPKTVYIQVFNISSHILSTIAAYLAWAATFGLHVAPPHQLDASTRSVLGASAALFAFLAVNHLSLALALWWARGVPPRDSGLLGLEGLITDVTLLTIGVVMAALWSAGPWLVLFALVPFTLLQRALYFPELRQASRTDSKTGLLNATYFLEVAEDELRRAQRTGHHLSVLVADLDLLRNINNAYGHLAGDVILKGVSRILREEVREYDVVSRFGGEEFAVLLPVASAEEAHQVAERIRGRVARDSFEVDTSVTPINATVSIGLSTLGEHGNTVKELMHAADLAVYRAKVDGRDRVRIANPDDDEATAPLSLSVPSSPTARLLPASIDPPRPLRAVAGAPAADETALAADLGEAPARSDTVRARPLGPQRRTWPVTVATAAASTVMALLCLRYYTGPTWALVVFPVLALVAELSGENIYGSSFVSLSGVPILAAVAIGQPGAALIAAGISGLAGSVIGRNRLEQAVFNTANFVLCAATAVTIRALLTHRAAEPQNLPLLAGVMVLATIAYFLVDNGLVSLIVARDEGRRAWRVFREDLAWLAPHFLVFGLVGLLLGAAWQSFGLLGMVVFLLPPLLVRLAQRQYLARTASNVAELRRLAEDLGVSKDAVERSNVALERALVAVRERHLATARALAGAIDARDKTTGGHIERVSALGVAMCEVVDPILAKDPQVAFGFLLHDVGKIGIPDSILLKAGPLTSAERLVINEHPAIGEVLLGEAGFADIAREIVYTHHERWDGTGYPRGLAGTEIPLCTRIFSVADSLDAMTNDRPYRKGIDLEEALDELRAHSGSQFDPGAVEALLTIPEEKIRELLRLGRETTDVQAALARLLG